MIRAIVLLLEATVEIRSGGTAFKERPYYCWWKTDFVAGGNHFFHYFSVTPASFFPSSRNDVPEKSFILASGNRF